MILLLTSLLGERLPASAFPEAIPLTVLASSVGPSEGGTCRVRSMALA